MATIIREGCVARCTSCQTEFSFMPHEVGGTKKRMPPGYSPEEEAYDRYTFKIGCPKCHHRVDVSSLLGEDAKVAVRSRIDSDDLGL